MASPKANPVYLPLLAIASGQQAMAQRLLEHETIAVMNRYRDGSAATFDAFACSESAENAISWTRDRVFQTLVRAIHFKPQTRLCTRAPIKLAILYERYV